MPVTCLRLRYLLTLCLCVGLLAGGSAHADPPRFVSDAFGLVPFERYTGSERESWAGHVENMSGQQIRRTWHDPARTPEVLLLFVGPKSARAGADDVHGVGLALDPAGNLVPDGILTRFRPGFGDALRARTSGGLASFLFRPPVQARMYHAGASIGDVQSMRAEYRVVPDLESVSLALQESAAPLRQEALHTLSSQPIADRYGNPVEAGIAVSMTLAHMDGAVSRLDGVTTGDTARLPVLVRGLDSDVAARLSLGSVLSPPVAFDVRKITVQATPQVGWTDLPGIGGMRITVGPFLTSAGHLLNDGSAVSLSLRFADGSHKAAQGWVVDGMFEAIVPAGPDLLPAEVRIEAGDSVARVRLGAGDHRLARRNGWQE